MKIKQGIPTPSPLAPHPSRAALTLTEVLIAMGILTIGLLGVASVFPVGGFYMQSGDIADQGGAIAQAALEDAIIRGHLDPENWIVHHLNTSGANSGFQRLISGVAVFPPLLRAQGTGLQADLGRSYPAQALSQTMNRERYLATVHGGAYAIDTVGMGGAIGDPSQQNDVVINPLFSGAARRFPAFGGLFTRNAAEWDAFQVDGAFWPVRRVTVVESPWFNSSSGEEEFMRPLTVSRHLATADDDLALTLPNDGDIPARQQWQSWNTGTSPAFPSSRQSAGDYSWLITVAPASSPERDTFAVQPDAHPVEVSTVVFHKRLPTRGYESTLEAERLVTARVVSAGPGGGEVLLQRRPAGSTGPASPYTAEPEISPFQDLREGQYVMVVAPHPTSTINTPRLALRWCRVLSIQNEGQPNLNGTNTQLGVIRSGDDETERVLVALRGPDWPWQPAADFTDDNALSNDLRVAILPGIVAVHTKTMRLEAGSEWSID
ncbi:MAG: hypothetical protein AAF266_05420 [Planctomycetota bacterium]